MNETLPLFPLHTVLLPGAALGLRLFERRYLDMVSDCGRNGRGFGICLILEGDEAGVAATPASSPSRIRQMPKPRPLRPQSLTMSR